jgi:hypothetical protein
MADETRPSVPEHLSESQRAVRALALGAALGALLAVLARRR